MSTDDSTSTTRSNQPLDEKPGLQLETEAWRYEFFQAVRLLTSSGGSKAVGHDFDPGQEAVRFRAHVSHSFPQGQIASFTPADQANDDRPDDRPLSAEMVVSFIGLTGPAGVLPHHYTQTIINRLRAKDHSLRDFLDIFNHRIVSLFYRAWEKHRVSALIENRHATDMGEDLFTTSLLSLVGLNPRAMRNRFSHEDRAFLYYGGLFAGAPPSAVCLERLVEEMFQAPTLVQQFQGQWLTLEADQQTEMPSDASPGLNNTLGVSAIAGQRVWSIDSKFRLRLGPLGYDEFMQFTPGAARLVELGQVVRSYVGPELDFDIQPVLRREEVPACQLTAPTETTGNSGPRLGWNTWVHSAPMRQDAEDAVFVSEGQPSR